MKAKAIQGRWWAENTRDGQWYGRAVAQTAAGTVNVYNGSCNSEYHHTKHQAEEVARQKLDSYAIKQLASDHGKE